MENEKIKEAIERLKKHTPQVLELDPRGITSVGMIVKEVTSLEKEIRELTLIREQYERKFHIRMFADGTFKEIET